MGELKDWLDSRLVRIDSSGNIVGECGTSKNKKRPLTVVCLAPKANSLSKSERAATARKKKREGAKGKQVVSNTRPLKSVKPLTVEKYARITGVVVR